MTDPPTYLRPPPGTQPEYLFPGYASTVKRAPTRPLVLLPGANGAPDLLTTWRSAGQKNPEDSL